MNEADILGLRAGIYFTTLTVKGSVGHQGLFHLSG